VDGSGDGQSTEPFAAISSVDRQFGEVFLAVSKDILLKDHARLPGGTMLRVDAAPMTGADVIVAEQHTT
jgi:hypothetical protein